MTIYVLMNVAEYLIKRLTDHGVKHLFMITGGAAMYLNDAVIKQKKIKYICNHHEQASTMAAEGYARIVNDIGVVMVTSGAAATNTISGVLGAWQDSIPLLIISGNVKREMLTYKRPALRELGIQDTRIVDIVKPLTKYAIWLERPEDVAYHLEQAIYLALTPRQGPVWLDIPLDVQSTEIDEKTLRHFTPPENRAYNLTKVAEQTVEKLKSSKDPIILAGGGIRLSGAVEVFNDIVMKLKIPVLTSLTGHDLLYEKHPYYGGRFGMWGTPKGVEHTKQADCMLILAERLQIWQIGYEYKDFGKHAYKIMVDIDPEELAKHTLKLDKPILADVKDFLVTMNKIL